MSRISFEYEQEIGIVRSAINYCVNDPLFVVKIVCTLVCFLGIYLIGSGLREFVSVVEYHWELHMRSYASSIRDAHEEKED